jgi:two-component sensor histidine kinase
MKRILLLIFLFIANFGALYGQNTPSSNTFESHFELAKKYEDLSLYAESIDEINLAIQFAEKKGWKKKIVEASIFLAETKRITGDFEEGIRILRTLKSSTDYPALHVEKLGRMAALFRESQLPNGQKLDSLNYYLTSALDLVEVYNLKSQKAGLYNELGCIIGHENADSCLYLLNESARIFLEERDIQNYVAARTNMLRTYETLGDNLNTIATFNELIELVKGKKWYSAERELYITISSFHNKKGDTVNANYWLLKSRESEILNIHSISSNRLNSFRAIYETEKYQNQIAQNQIELKKQAKKRNELFLYLTILLVISALVLLLLFRERKLKRTVGKANESYEMLLVESNHRIKNNLQMIISMLQYSSRDLKDEDSKAFKNMSGKIQTISALHKHLYIDVHNELVDLNGYFTAIIALYQDISSDKIRIKVDIDEVSIKSERIVYFGLIFNEMLSNTFEHGKGLEGNLEINVKAVNSHYHFSYQDNSSFVDGEQNGTGITLIKQLVGRVKGIDFQLDGIIGKYEFYFQE